MKTQSSPTLFCGIAARATRVICLLCISEGRVHHGHYMHISPDWSRLTPVS